MDHAERFAERGRVLDDLLLAAFRLPAERFTERPEDGGPSLRDLVVGMVDRPRRFVNAVLLGREVPPLRGEAYGAVTTIGPLLGGFRLTLRDVLESLGPEDLARPVEHDGTTATVARHLDRLLEQDAADARRAAKRLEEFGVTPPRV